MLKKNGKGVAIYKDHYRPVQVMRNGVAVAGYNEEPYISNHIEVEDTYNDLLKCRVQGKHTQDSKYLIKWNQLFKTDNYSYDEYGVTILSIDDYTLNIKVENFSCTYALILHYGVNINWVEGHKYYINGSKRTSGNSAIVISRNITGDSACLYLKEDAIITSAYNKSYHLNTVIALSQVDFEVTFSPVVIDLTEMFGAGFEPTIEECRKLFTCDYYPYNEGEWIPMPIIEETVENTLTSAYQSPCPEYPEEVIPVSNPKISISNHKQLIPITTEIPFTLYGDGVVNDEVEPCVLVDGEWKCRVTRRWWKAFVKIQNLYEPDKYLSQFLSNKNACFHAVSKNIKYIDYIAKSGTRIYGNVFYKDKDFTSIYLGGKKGLNSIQMHPTQRYADQGLFYATIEFSAIGLPSDYYTDSYTEFVNDCKSFSQWTADNDVYYMIYQLFDPIIELYPPINVRTLPINSVIDCDTEIKADIKINDTTSPKHVIVAKSNWDNQVVGGVRWQLNKVTDEGYEMSGRGNITNFLDSDLVASKIIVTSKDKTLNRVHDNNSELVTLDTSLWDTSNIEQADYLFRRCSLLNEIDLSKLDLSSLQSLTCTFQLCTKASVIILPSQMYRITALYATFYYCTSLIELDLSGRITNSVTNMDSAFYYCSNLIRLNLSRCDLSNVALYTNMFTGCKLLTDIYAYDCNQATIDFLNSVKPEGTTLHTER